MAKFERITVRGIRRETPDYRKLGSIVLDLVAAQAEADAQAEHERAATLPQQAKPRQNGRKPRPRRDGDGSEPQRG
jgi:hypothetical protein